MANHRKFTDTEKYCYSCNTVKCLSLFSSDKSRAGGLSSICKLCRKLKYIKNKEKVLNQSKLYYATNKDTKLQSNKLWRNKNLDKHKSLVKSWANKHKNIRREQSAKRRAFKNKATPSWLTLEHKQWIAWIYTQAVNLEKLTGIPHHVDHIVPLNNSNVCGLHVPWNLQILTATENLKKSNKYE